MTAPSSPRRGFTLVELLVVIGILALLISVLLPGLNKARQAAMDVKCQSNLRQIGVAMMLYADQNKGVFPYDGDPRYTNVDGDRAKRSLGWWDDPGLWTNAVANAVVRRSYGRLQLEQPIRPLPNDLNGNSVFVCPTAAPAGNSTATTTEAAGGYFVMYGHDNPLPAPAVLGTPMAAGTTDTKSGPPTARNVYVSYGINSKLNASHNPAKQSQLRPSSTIVMVMDRRVNLGELPAAVSAAYGSPGGNDLPSRQLNRIHTKWDYATARHHQGGNVLMADGHVQWFSLRELVLPPGYTAGSTTTDFNQPGRIVWDPFAPATAK